MAERGGRSFGSCSRLLDVVDRRSIVWKSPRGAKGWEADGAIDVLWRELIGEDDVRIMQKEIVKGWVTSYCLKVVSCYFSK